MAGGDQQRHVAVADYILIVITYYQVCSLLSLSGGKVIDRARSLETNNKRNKILAFAYFVQHRAVCDNTLNIADAISYD